jgi:hypothetical protein
VANTPTVYITASDQHRNGKTLLARLLADYLLLDGRDPFMIDTDAPDGPLRKFFPGRTVLADFAAMPGQMKLFDTIVASPGRDYVIDLPARHIDGFFQAVIELNFFEELKKLGFRIIVFYVVDRQAASLRAAKSIQKFPNIDLFVPVENQHVGSLWPKSEGDLVIPALPQALAIAIADKRFSLRSFVLGDTQHISEEHQSILSNFLYEVLNNLGNLEPLVSLQSLKH